MGERGEGRCEDERGRERARDSGKKGERERESWKRTHGVEKSIPVSDKMSKTISLDQLSIIKFHMNHYWELNTEKKKKKKNNLVNLLYTTWRHD